MALAQSQPQALLFDLDGTLFRTETLSIPAYHAMFRQLRADGDFVEETPPESLFLGGLGMLLSEIWARVMPNASAAVHRRADTLLLEHQLRLLEDGLGELYPGVQETLTRLHGQGIRLFVASNGLEAYVKRVVAAMGIAPLFIALYSAGEFQTASKVDLVRLLLSQHELHSAWMCGDRKSDVEAGQQNNLPVVACDYAGFHVDDELRGAEMTIHAFPELLNLVSAGSGEGE